MLEWIGDNKEWLFSGAGIALLAGIWAMYKLTHKPNGIPQVIVQMEHSPSAKEGEVSKRDYSPPVHIDRISSISPKDIKDAIDKALPLQKLAIYKSFEGIKIEWDTLLTTATEENGNITLMLSLKDVMMLYVWCSVKYADYRELGIMPKDSKIRVYGVIETVDNMSVRLRDVELKYIEAHENS
ncbi:MAG: hypothetical protein KAR40_15115 [Candidatus Sabulitectum sp.]|nr:hypothetical protein [Candidatus Sabulitectum sp.]